MIESLLPPTGPAHELRVSSEMLDVTSTAGLLPVLTRSVQAQTPTEPDAEVVMTGQTGVGIDAFAARVAFAAICVAFELSVGPSQLPRREKLGASRSRHERTADGGSDHHTGQDGRGRGSPIHEEKIQR